MTQDNDKQLPVAINDCHQLLAWIIPQLDHFPRSRRYTLGEKLELHPIECRHTGLAWAFQAGRQLRLAQSPAF